MKRSPAMQRFVDRFAKNVFGMSHAEAKANCCCVVCHQPADNFRDEISRREYDISGMCQKCQDGVFGNSKSD